MIDKGRWRALQGRIRQCTRCKQRQVRCDLERKIPVIDPGDVKVLFISEAPPLGPSYFYYEHGKDRLREALFEVLRGVGYDFHNLRQFVDAGFYLVPTVKCPSSANGHNKSPALSVIRTCVNYLRNEIDCINPKGVCMLGRTALKGCSLLYPIFDT
jgi:uracil-DNA glycosylase